MLKSRGRTNEISVMEMEGWPQVNCILFSIIQLNTRISSMSKRVTTHRKGWCLVPKVKQELSIDSLRHAEYYGMQQTYDDLYAKSRNGERFPKLMDIVLSRGNILLAYRNIKANTGSNTPGTDRLTIQNIGCLSTEEIVDKIRRIVNGKRGYCPKPVRRKDIPKPNGSTRPLGIPCIWDRLIQQCIKQVMEPICEAKFSNNSYGFRPGRSVEHAISRTYQLLQLSHLHYVIEFEIKGFFDVRP